MKLGTKLIAMGTACVVLAAGAMTVVGIVESRSVVAKAKEELTLSSNNDLRHLAESALSVAKSYDQYLRESKGAQIDKYVRQAILSARVGKSGYIWVISGKEASKGHYIISKDGQRDGENVWDSMDADGKYCIREMVNKAVTLTPGDVFLYRYMWKNSGEDAARQKVAAVTYYEPWGWVIGASCYEDELFTIQALTGHSRIRRVISPTMVAPEERKAKKSQPK